MGKYFFDLKSIKPTKSSSAGSLTYVTEKEMPGLVNMSFEGLTLNSNGFLEPLWHPNANKVGYCTQGKARVTMRTPVNLEKFFVSKGDIFFIPKGYVHHIENIGDGRCVIHFALNSSNPETMRLSKAFTSISENVFNRTFDTPENFISTLKKNNNNDQAIVTLPGDNIIPGNMNSKYKFDIENSEKAVETKGGYVQSGTVKNLPELEGLGILGFGLNVKGCVEPHWHTNAGELIYIIKGKTKITLLSPDGNVEVMEVGEGQGAFAPASYFHNIENIADEETEVIAFFGHQDPDYIGIGEVIGSFTNELLSTIFNTTPEYFDAIHKTEEPLVIVPV